MQPFNISSFRALQNGTIDQLALGDAVSYHHRKHF